VENVPKRDMREFSLGVSYLVASKLIFVVQLEDPNLLVLLYCLCLAFPEYSGIENDNETEPVTVASAGCWIFSPTVHYCVSFKDETTIHPMSHEMCQLHSGPGHPFNCFLCYASPLPPGTALFFLS
jgi:hypothetical protein